MKKLILFLLFYLIVFTSTGCNPCADPNSPESGSGSTDIVGLVVYPETESGGTYAFSSDGSEMKLIRDDAAIFAPPQAGKIVYTLNPGSSDAQDKVVISDVDGKNSTTIFTTTTTGIDLWYSSLSPDGKYVLFYQSEDGGFNDYLWIMRSDGSDLRKVSNTRVPETLPTFSPDSRYIAYVTMDTQLHVQTVEGIEVGVIATDARIGGDGFASLSWSVDNKIAYVTQAIRDAQYNVIIPPQIAIINMNGSNKHIITHGSECGQPTWKPDGSQLCFASEDGHIYTASSDGSNVSSVIYLNGTPVTNPDWSKDGKKILFTERNYVGIGDAFNGILKYLNTTDGSVHYVASSCMLAYWK